MSYELEQAREQLQEGQGNLAEAKQNVSEQKKRIGEYEEQVSGITVPRRSLKFQQEYVRTGKVSMGRSQQYVKTRANYKRVAGEQIGKAKGELETYEKGDLAAYEQEINRFGGQVKEQEAYESAVEYWKDGQSYFWFKGEPEYKYLKRLWTEYGSYKRMQQERAEAIKFNKELKRLEITPVIKDNKIVGFYDDKLNMSYDAKELPTVLQKYRTEDIPQFTKLGLVEKVPENKMSMNPFAGTTFAENMAGASLLPEYRTLGYPGQFNLTTKQKEGIVRTVSSGISGGVSLFGTVSGIKTAVKYEGELFNFLESKTPEAKLPTIYDVPFLGGAIKPVGKKLLPEPVTSIKEVKDILKSKSDETTVGGSLYKISSNVMSIVPSSSGGLALRSAELYGGYKLLKPVGTGIMKEFNKSPQWFKTTFGITSSAADVGIGAYSVSQVLNKDNTTYEKILSGGAAGLATVSLLPKAYTLTKETYLKSISSRVKERNMLSLPSSDVVEQSRQRATFLLEVTDETGKSKGIVLGENAEKQFISFGGKIEKGETPLQAALRETTEESGLNPNKIKNVRSLGRFGTPEETQNIFIGQISEKDFLGLKAQSDVKRLKIFKPSEFEKIIGQSSQAPRYVRQGNAFTLMFGGNKVRITEAIMLGRLEKIKSAREFAGTLNPKQKESYLNYIRNRYSKKTISAFNEEELLTESILLKRKQGLKKMLLPSNIGDLETGLQSRYDVSGKKQEKFLNAKIHNKRFYENRLVSPEKYLFQAQDKKLLDGIYLTKGLVENTGYVGVYNQFFKNGKVIRKEIHIDADLKRYSGKEAYQNTIAHELGHFKGKKFIQNLGHKIKKIDKLGIIPYDYYPDEFEANMFMKKAMIKGGINNKDLSVVKYKKDVKAPQKLTSGTYNPITKTKGKLVVDVKLSKRGGAGLYFSPPTAPSKKGYVALSYVLGGSESEYKISLLPKFGNQRRILTTSSVLDKTTFNIAKKMLREGKSVKQIQKVLNKKAPLGTIGGTAKTAAGFETEVAAAKAAFEFKKGRKVVFLEGKSVIINPIKRITSRKKLNEVYGLYEEYGKASGLRRLSLARKIKQKTGVTPRVASRYFDEAAGNRVNYISSPEILSKANVRINTKESERARPQSRESSIFKVSERNTRPSYKSTPSKYNLRPSPYFDEPKETNIPPRYKYTPKFKEFGKFPERPFEPKMPELGKIGYKFPPFKSPINKIINPPIKRKISFLQKKKRYKPQRQTKYIPSFAASALNMTAYKKPKGTGKDSYLPGFRPIIIRKSKKRKYK